MFKIVYIRDLRELEPVPTSWEEGGVCWFPSKQREIKQYQCDGTKKPDKISWPNYKCEVKANGISSWELANNMANALCDYTSEEDSEEGNPPDPHRTSETKRAIKRPSAYDDHFVYEIKKGRADEATREGKTDSAPQSPLANVEDYGDLTITTNNNDLVLASASDIEDLKIEVNGCKSEIQKIKEEIVSDVKKYIDEKFVAYGLQIQNIENLLKRDGISATTVIEEKETEINILPLATLKDVKAFETKLLCSDYQKKVIVHLRKIIGTGYNHRSACYKLSAVMFTKKLLTSFSWTGVSRGETTKESFSKLNNILAVFYHVVKYSDQNFTYCQRDGFFRDGILKHSHSRVKPKPAKKSTENNKENEDVTEIEEFDELPQNMVESYFKDITVVETRVENSSENDRQEEISLDEAAEN